MLSTLARSRPASEMASLLLLLLLPLLPLLCAVLLRNLRPLAALRLTWSALSVREPPQPMCLLVLGGSKRRELLAASAMDVSIVLLSSGSTTAEDVVSTFDPERAARTTVIVDRTATDTVTNFTSVVHALNAAGVRSIAVGTARAHMPRALAIGRVVLGAQGIHIVPLPVDAGEALNESWLRVLRDAVRALLWVLCGLHFGGFVGRLVHPYRFLDSTSWLAKRRYRDHQLVLELRSAMGADR